MTSRCNTRNRSIMAIKTESVSGIGAYSFGCEGSSATYKRDSAEHCRKMLPLAFVTIFLVGTALSSPIANQYFESLLNVALPGQVRSLSLDPATVPDFATDFEDKVKIIGKVKGRAEFFSGRLTGLSRARRYSECQGPYYSYGTRILNCTVGFDDLAIHYDGKMKYGKMPKVNIKGNANVTSTLLFVEVSQAPPTQPALKNFVFSRIGALNVKFTGLGPLNRFTKFLEDGFRAHVQAEIFNSMSQRLQFALGKAVGQVPLPTFT